MKRLISLILLIAYAPWCIGATYYVDWATGDDTRAGTSPETCWKRVPGMTSIAAGTTVANTVLQAGDVVLLKSGEVHYFDASVPMWTGGIVDGDDWGGGADAIIDGNYLETRTSGVIFGTGDSNAILRNVHVRNFGRYSPTHPIYDGMTISSVDPATDTFTTSAAHTLVVGDDVKFTNATIQYPGGISATSSRESSIYYVVATPSATEFRVSASAGGAVRDITSAGTGTTKVWEPVSAPDGSFSYTGIAHFSSGSGNLIENVVVTQIGQWKNQPPMSGTNSVTGFGIGTENARNLTIRNANISRTRTGIGIKATSLAENVLVENCDIHEYCVWLMDIAPRADYAILRNIEIKNSRFRDYWQHNSGAWRGFGEKPHTDGIFLRSGGAPATMDNIRIHGCDFYKDAPVGSGGTASIYVSQGPSALIYNNVFNGDNNTRCIDIIGGSNANILSQTVRVYNNTFKNVAQYVWFQNRYNRQLPGMPFTAVAATDVFTAAAHDFIVDDIVTIRSKTGGAGLPSDWDYTMLFRVASVPTADTFSLKTTSGSAVNLTTDITAGSIGKINMEVTRFWHASNNLFLENADPSTLVAFHVNNYYPTMTEMDNNLYFNSLNPATVQPVTEIQLKGGKNTLSETQGFGYDLLSTWGDPLLVKTSGVPSTQNLRPLPGSPAILAGKNLSEFFTTDKDGNARPASGAWTVGAYQDNSVTPADVTPPTLVSATLGPDGQSGILVFSEPMQNINLSHYAVSGHTLGTLLGSGTTWYFTLSPKRQAGPDFDLVYTAGGGRSADLAGNLLASGTFTIENNSLEATPEPPRAQRRGPAAPKRKPIGL